MGQLWIVALWFAHTTFALPSRDGDEQEYFPLSGGIANGVMVTINAEIDTTKATTIEFLTPAREVAFGWYLNFDAKTLQHGRRNSKSEAIYPTAALPVSERRVELRFMKRRFQWGVEINGKAQSWYSFTIPLEEVVTHVSVHTGFKDPEVVQQRQQCTVQCHEDECRGADGAPMCQEGMRCTTTKRSANPLEASACSASSEADDVYENCCDGKPLTIPLDASFNQKWVRLIASAQMTDFCADYPHCDEMLVQVANRSNNKGKILGIDGDSYTLAVPGRLMSLQTDQIQQFPHINGTHMKIPNFALRRSTERNIKRKVKASTDIRNANYALDKSKILVSSTLPDHMDVQGWFLEFVTVAFDGENGTRWLRGPTGAANHRRNPDSEPGDFWYSDQGEVTGAVCTDAPYTGEQGLEITCGNWTAGDWCHPWGQKKPELCEDTGLAKAYCDSPNWRPIGLFQCCHCGGGSWTPPAESAYSTSHLLFQ